MSIPQCGLDIDKVERCLDIGRYTKVIKKQSEEAKLSGINGIPTYVIGDFLIEGVQPYPLFQRTVEAALGKSKG